VADKAMQGEPGGCHGPLLASAVVKTLALEQQCRPVELQPRLKHLALAEAVHRRLGTPRVGKVSSHEPKTTNTHGSRPDRPRRLAGEADLDGVRVDELLRQALDTSRTTPPHALSLVPGSPVARAADCYDPAVDDLSWATI